MTQSDTEPLKLPLKEMMKSLPGIVGIRSEEKPPYEVVATEGDVELRRYHPLLVAELTTPGNPDVAASQAFRRLARYIFGANHAQTAMPMTSPVLQEPAGARRRLTFIMPSGYTRDTLPQPLDTDIQIVEIPARTVAVIRYSGNNTEERRHKSAGALQTWLAASRRVALSPVRWAQYDAPFTLPFLKRNEAQVDIDS